MRRGAVRGVAGVFMGTFGGCRWRCPSLSLRVGQRVGRELMVWVSMGA